MKDTAPPTTEKTPPTQISRPALRFDWMDWLPYLEDADIPDEQKREWIETVWSIVLAFVDLGFDIKSAPEICGEEIDLHAILSAGVLNLADAQTDETEACHE